MTNIEVEWTVKPKTGLTSIDLSELGCENREAWEALSPGEQTAKLNEILIETDQPNLRATAVGWEIIDD